LGRSNCDFTWIEFQQSIQASSENHTWLAADIETIAKTDWKTNREPTCQDFCEKALRFIREAISRISRRHKNRELASCRCKKGISCEIKLWRAHRRCPRSSPPAYRTCCHSSGSEKALSAIREETSSPNGADANERQSRVRTAGRSFYRLMS
jgi:hypothetical protein